MEENTKISDALFQINALANVLVEIAVLYVNKVEGYDRSNPFISFSEIISEKAEYCLDALEEERREAEVKP